MACPLLPRIRHDEQEASMLQRILENVFRSGPEALEGGSGLVLSLPVPLRAAVEERAPGIQATAEVFRRLFEGARSSLKVFSPYVDPTFTALAQAATAPLQVVTTLREARMKSSPVLERLATTRPLAVRYLHEKHAKSQMFQLHAKMVLSDSALAYVGSANLTDTSLHYNFELGVLVEDPVAIARLHSIFDYVFHSAARPASQL
jgi:phosphatidylserine/phosphatidylglycerophosphate/cardiolipin synthase-like enzyme